MRQLAIISVLFIKIISKVLRFPRRQIRTINFTHDSYNTGLIIAILLLSKHVALFLLLIRHAD